MLSGDSSAGRIRPVVRPSDRLRTETPTSAAPPRGECALIATDVILGNPAGGANPEDSATTERPDGRALLEGAPRTH